MKKTPQLIAHSIIMLTIGRNTVGDTYQYLFLEVMLFAQVASQFLCSKAHSSVIQIIGLVLCMNLPVKIVLGICVGKKKGLE